MSLQAIYDVVGESGKLGPRGGRRVVWDGKCRSRKTFSNWRKEKWSL